MGPLYEFVIYYLETAFKEFIFVPACLTRHSKKLTLRTRKCETMTRTTNLILYLVRHFNLAETQFVNSTNSPPVVKIV